MNLPAHLVVSCDPSLHFRELVAPLDLIVEHLLEALPDDITLRIGEDDVVRMSPALFEELELWLEDE